MGPPRLYAAFAPSPDGRFLLVAWLERPFSYTVPCGRFPKRIQVWDRCAPLPAGPSAGVEGRAVPHMVAASCLPAWAALTAEHCTSKNTGGAFYLALKF